MTENRVKQLQEYGQSIWIDFIQRKMIASGELAELIRQDGIRGVTSNPKIFMQAITGSDDYEKDIRTFSEEGLEAAEIYRRLALEDVRNAADQFRDLYEESGGDHGFVSLEVNPHLAYKTQATVDEARELWRSLDRPNVFIKVPATREGLPAITRLISEGINVNVTLLFGLPRYREVAEAYIAGLTLRAEQGGSLEGIQSVASFFLSRIDVLVDSLLDDRVEKGELGRALASEIRGETAIASAKGAYQIYGEIFTDNRFGTLAARGARRQRLLWASTSTKDPDYSDVKYVEALIGPETVNTLPIKTLEAFRDHGKAARRLEEGLDQARRVLDRLPEAGIDIDDVTSQLEEEGVEKFNRPHDKLLESLEKEQAKVVESTRR